MTVTAATLSPSLANLISITPCVARPKRGMFLTGSLIA